MNSKLSILNNDELYNLQTKVDVFNSLSNIEKKKNYFLIKSKFKDNIIYDFLIDVNVNKDKYDLSYLEVLYFNKKVRKFLSNTKNIESYYIDPFNITKLIPINLINNVFSHNILSTNKYKQNFDFSYIKSHENIEKFGIYIISKEASPAFNNFKMVLKYLKNYFNLYLFLENNKEDLNNEELEIISNTNVFYIKNMSDDDLTKLIYKQKLSILLSIYCYWKRRYVFKKMIVPFQISYLEPSIIYPKYYFEYNLIDENIFNEIYPYIDQEKFGLMVMKNTFIFPIPKYSKSINITKPIFDKKNIKIGIIAHPLKICNILIKVIKEIIKINKNIIITIYGKSDKNWINNIFKSKQVVSDIYDNKNPTKLLDNIFFIDTILYNSHSTALEILNIKRPFISYYNKKNYHGIFSQSIIKYINMDKYLLAYNPIHYVKLIQLYIENENIYNQLYHKFIKNLENSKILCYQHYTKQFVDTIKKYYNKK